MRLIAILLFTVLAGCSIPAPTSPPTVVLPEQARADALAFGAVLAMANDESPTSLPQLVPVEVGEEKRKMLAEWWDIRSRDNVFETLHWIDEGGHRKLFWEIREKLRGVRIEHLPAQIYNPERNPDENNRWFIAALSLRAPAAPVPELTAWDYGRYINVCRWAYLAGYISRDETWDLIMPVARYLRASYSSWADYGDDYLRGREFWSLTQTKRIGEFHRQTVKRLQEPGSPWSPETWTHSLGEGKVANDPWWDLTHKSLSRASAGTAGN